ncbi:MAG: MerR family transcriptional regulator, partial [Chloroflexi bacterium]|nr:MerR family transcriptional regulator [Chloroflexota bacterium]
TGVTKRTLHYYDRVGLLKPSRKTEAGHRWYTHTDLLRLQQILTFKWIGFDLKQIKALLTQPDYDLLQSLRGQLHAVEGQITRLEAARDALAETIDRIDAEEAASDLDPALVNTIIQGVLRGDQADTLWQFYSNEAQAGLQTRWIALSPEEQQAAEQDWVDLFAGFAAKQHLPADHPEVQALAAQMQHLIDAFTGGDPEVEDGLRKLSEAAQAGALPNASVSRTAHWRVEDDLRDYIECARRIYLSRANRRPDQSP